MEKEIEKEAKSDHQIHKHIERKHSNPIPTNSFGCLIQKVGSLLNQPIELPLRGMRAFSYPPVTVEEDLEVQRPGENQNVPLEDSCRCPTYKRKSF